MRTLCLQIEETNSQIFSQNFANFTNKIKYRSPGLLFADITDTIRYFGKESHFLKELRSYHKEFYPGVKTAIGKDPIHAQVFCQNLDNYFSCPESEEANIINQLPLQSLHHFEGLSPWRSQNEVEDAVTFFSSVGLRTIKDLKNIDSNTFKNKWGQLGIQLWRRLHGLEQQIIAPQLNHTYLLEQIEFNLPISLHTYLLFNLERGLRKLLFHQDLNKKSPERLRVYLYCKWNYDVHLIDIPIINCLHIHEIYEELDKHIRLLDLSNPVVRADLELLQGAPSTTDRSIWNKTQVEKKKRISKRTMDHGSSVLTVQTSLDNELFDAQGIFEEPSLAILDVDADPRFDILLNNNLVKSKSQESRISDSHEEFYDLFRDDNYKEDFFDILSRNN